MKNDNRKDEAIVALWPFRRCDVIIPKEVQEDVFAWLFLSLVVYANEDAGKDRYNYDQKIAKRAEELICAKLDDTINDEMLRKIRDNVENNNRFVGEEDSGKRTITYEGQRFIETFQSVFADKLEIRTIYQDLITGSVAPYLSEIVIEEPKYNSDDQGTVRFSYDGRIDYPTTAAIKRAVQVFNAKSSQASVDYFDEDDDYFYDFEGETFLDEHNSLDDDSSLEHQETKISSNDFNVVYVENSSSTLFYRVELIVEGNRVFCRKPDEFPDTLQHWFDRVFVNAVNQNQKVKENHDILAACLIPDVEEEKSKHFHLASGKDIASQLGLLGRLYRIVGNAPATCKDELQNMVKEMYWKMSGGDVDFYTAQGRLLEAMLELTLDRKSRDCNISYRDLNALIDEAGQQTGINMTHFHGQGIHHDYTGTKLLKQNGRFYKSFKADLVDMIIFNKKIRTSKFKYTEFANDAASLYNQRNDYSAHYNANAVRSIGDAKSITKLNNVALLLIDIQ